MTFLDYYIHVLQDTTKRISTLCTSLVGHVMTGLPIRLALVVLHEYVCDDYQVPSKDRLPSNEHIHI